MRSVGHPGDSHVFIPFSQNFHSTFVISMDNPLVLNDGPSVEMTNVIMKVGNSDSYPDCIVKITCPLNLRLLQGGVAGVGISNDGGFLKVKHLAMIGVEMMSGIAGANGAVSSLSYFAVTESNLRVSLFEMYSIHLSHDLDQFLIFETLDGHRYVFESSGCRS